VGLTLIIVGPGLIWSGVRSFLGKPARVLVLGGGLLVWFLTMALAGMYGRVWVLAVVVNTSLAVSCNAATAWELARERIENLRARGPLIVLIAVNVLVLSMAIPDALTNRMPAFEPAPLASLFGLIHFETIVYVIGTTVFFVALMKERSELQQRHEAQTDVLTGLANRRAFVSKGERLAERCRRDKRALAIASFDLDHFKSVNDTFGHSMGDRTLQIFARIATEALRPNDIFSRVGGEEFTAIFPGADLDAACAMAERIRKAFERTGLLIDGKPVGATVSAGVTASEDASVPLSAMLERADEALYKAKLNGRNRIECADADCRTKTYPHLVRVA
jgi:diguanylate cyclase (GGDEF)-like protein